MLKVQVNGRHPADQHLHTLPQPVLRMLPLTIHPEGHVQAVGNVTELEVLKVVEDVLHTTTESPRAPILHPPKLPPRNHRMTVHPMLHRRLMSPVLTCKARVPLWSWPVRIAALQSPLFGVGMKVATRSAMPVVSVIAIDL